MMYTSQIMLPQESAKEILQSLYCNHRMCFDPSKDINGLLDGIIGGSITHKYISRESVLELKILSNVYVYQLTANEQAEPEQNCDDHSRKSERYELLKNIYEIMKEKHKETIVPMGTGPSKRIGLLIERQTPGGKISQTYIGEVSLN